MSYCRQSHRGCHAFSDQNSDNRRDRRSYQPRHEDHPHHNSYRQASVHHPPHPSEAEHATHFQYRLTKQSGYNHQPKHAQAVPLPDLGHESQDGSFDVHKYENEHAARYEHHDAYSLAYEHSYDGSRCDNYMELRSRDTTRNIRDMNNWCKYVNITHSIRQAFKDNAEHTINILDLGCGKGSDLYKCRGNKKYIHKYLGIDIAEECVFAARRKYKRILQENIKHRNAPQEERKKFGLNNAYGQTAKEFYDGSFFDAQFICNDMTSPHLHGQRLISQYRPFHLINIQFALHYGFQTRSSLMALLKTTESATKPGSYFICSFVRDDVVIKRLSQSMQSSKQQYSDSISFENEFQWLQMKKTDFVLIQHLYKKHNLLKLDVNGLYENTQENQQQEQQDIDEQLFGGLVGIPYFYFQRDSVEGDNNSGVQEFFVPFAVLCKLLFKHCDMKLLYRKTARDIYLEYSRNFPYRHGYSKGRELDTVKWTNDEQQVIDTYGYALFQRL